MFDYLDTPSTTSQIFKTNDTQFANGRTITLRKTIKLRKDWIVYQIEDDGSNAWKKWRFDHLNNGIYQIYGRRVLNHLNSMNK